MDHLRTELDQLEANELDYVVARSNTTADKPAYEEAAYSKTAWFNLPAEHREYLNKLAMDLKRQRTVKALMILDENAEEAAKELVNLLDAGSESVKLSAAKDILDRTTGKPAQTVNAAHTGADGGAIEHKHYIITDLGMDMDEL